MAHNKNIRWNADGWNGENSSYTVHWRGIIPRTKLVKEVKKGIHPGCGTYTRNDIIYVRALPNKKTSDNIDK